MLKPGAPCPCCGQPIKTKDPAILAFLTYIMESGVNQAAYQTYVSNGRGSGEDCQFEMGDEACTPT